MPLTSAKLFEEILLSLSVLRYIIKSRSKRGLYDLNKQSERFFANVLNLTEGWNLINLNDVTKNHPAIDLGDDAARICVQVTSENRIEKINHTILQLCSNNLDKKYDRLIILILGDKKNYKSEFASTCYPNFDKKSDIWDIDDLLERIEKLSIEKLQALQQYLSVELAPIINSLALKNSLFANAEKKLDMGPVTCNEFLRFSRFEPDDGYWDDQLKSIKRLYKCIRNYSKQQREYLAFIIIRGKVEGSRWDERISIFPGELERLLNISQHESSAFFHVLKSDNLAWYDEDDRPGKIRINYVQDDFEFFVALRKFCKKQEDGEAVLQKIIVDGDFTLLD
jgi:hypothetical protein